MKILIAMSGGVDSSVAAGLLCKDGNECIGATMKLYHNEDAGIPRAHTCCSLDDVEDARSVCYKLGIPYYVFNFSDDFGEKIIDKFVRSYEAGLTPNPCIDCNRYMKFDKLYQRAEILGCDHIATGHYARITFENGQYQLRKALDETKDQSYVLYDMTQQRLARTLFPLGELRKTEARDLAREADFINCVAWRQQADFVHRFFTKGRKIGVVGSIQTRTYDAQDGSKRYVTEVVCDECEFVDSKPQGDGSQSYGGNAGYSAPAPAPKSSAPANDFAGQGFTQVDDDDQLPF